LQPRPIYAAIGERIEQSGPFPAKEGGLRELHQTGDALPGQDGVKQITEGIAAQPEGLIAFGTKVRQRRRGL
jgi:hypothetical protein